MSTNSSPTPPAPPQRPPRPTPPAVPLSVQSPSTTPPLPPPRVPPPQVPQSAAPPPPPSSSSSLLPPASVPGSQPRAASSPLPSTASATTSAPSSLPPRTFATDLNHGNEFNTVKTQAEVGMKSVKRLLSFFQHFRDLQRKFSSDVLKLVDTESKKILAMPIPDAMATAWSGMSSFFTLMKEMGIDHDDLAQNVHMHVVQPLDMFLEVGRATGARNTHDCDDIMRSRSECATSVAKSRGTAMKYVTQLQALKQQQQQQQQQQQHLSSSSSSFSSSSSSASSAASSASLSLPTSYELPPTPQHHHQQQKYALDTTNISPTTLRVGPVKRSRSMMKSMLTKVRNVKLNASGHGHSGGGGGGGLLTSLAESEQGGDAADIVQLDKVMTKAIKAVDEYSRAISAAVDRETYLSTHSLPHVLEQMQSLEEMRLRTLATGLSKFATFQLEFSERSRRVGDVTHALAQSLDGRADIARYIEQHGGGGRRTADKGHSSNASASSSSSSSSPLYQYDLPITAEQLRADAAALASKRCGTTSSGGGGGGGSGKSTQHRLFHVNLDELMIRQASSSSSNNNNSNNNSLALTTPSPASSCPSSARTSRASSIVSHGGGPLDGGGNDDGVASPARPPPALPARRYQHESHRFVPRLLATLATALAQPSCSRTEGLFRVSPSKQGITQLRDALETAAAAAEAEGDDVGDALFAVAMTYVTNVVDGAHILACVFKSFFRDCPTPLFPVTVFRDCVELGRVPPAEWAAALPTMTARVQKVIDRMQPVHRQALACLVALCRHVLRPEHAMYNLMSTSALGVVFAPNILRSGGAAGGAGAADAAAAAMDAALDMKHSACFFGRVLDLAESLKLAPVAYVI